MCYSSPVKPGTHCTKTFPVFEMLGKGKQIIYIHQIIPQVSQGARTLIAYRASLPDFCYTA